MADFVQELCDRTGISRDQCNQVISYLRQHRNELDQLISGQGGSAAGNVGNRNVGGQGGGSSRT